MEEKTIEAKQKIVGKKKKIVRKKKLLGKGNFGKRRRLKLNSKKSCPGPPWFGSETRK